MWICFRALTVGKLGPETTVEQLHSSTSQALDLRDLNPAQARGALLQLQTWETQPAAQAEQFLGELSVKAGLTKANLSESAVLRTCLRLLRKRAPQSLGSPRTSNYPLRNYHRFGTANMRAWPPTFPRSS